MNKKQLNVKIDEKDLRLIQKISKDRGYDVSDFIRILIKKELGRLGFLSTQEKKSLGV